MGDEPAELLGCERGTFEGGVALGDVMGFYAGVVRGRLSAVRPY